MPSLQRGGVLVPPELASWAARLQLILPLKAGIGDIGEKRDTWKGDGKVAAIPRFVTWMTSRPGVEV